MKVVGVVVLALCFCSHVLNAADLKAYNVDVDLTSVSGLSSGGYMAVQMHVAYSGIMIGAGVFAGGPYNCAEGNMNTALGTCMSGTPVASKYISITNSRSGGSIDNVSNLKDQQVYLFSGKSDTTVKPSVMNALHDYYKAFVDAGAGGNIVYENTLNAAHTQPTDDPKFASCLTSASPYISYCNYDGAGQALETIYGSLNNKGTAGSVMEFDQKKYISSGQGMAGTGYIYVPQSCANGELCALHVAFHGCQQYAGTIGKTYVDGAGYNEWAETNNIIVLYPQAEASYVSPLNPNGCWDWWGYSGSNYDVKSGAQMRAVREMIDTIASGYVRVDTPTGLKVSSEPSNTSVPLSWNTQSDVDGFNVYVDSARANVNLVKEPKYEATGLSSGTSYSFSITAVKGTAESLRTDPVIAKTGGDPPPVQPPTGLSVGTITSSSIQLTWNKAVGASDYNVYRDGNRVGSGVNGETYVDSGLASETRYSYYVTAMDMLGVESGKSNDVAATTGNSWVCKTYTDNNYAQVAAGRAYTEGGYCYAVGSDDSMGLYNIFIQTTLAETKQGYYTVGNCGSVLAGQ